MPRKDAKQQIMQSLKNDPNPFRLTDGEIAAAEQLLDEIEKGDAQWLDSLAELVDLLNVVLTEYENADQYNAAVEMDKEQLHQPIHIYQDVTPDQVMEELLKELEFQQKHPMYRYLNDCLAKCGEEEEKKYLAAFSDIAKKSDKAEVKESATAVLADCERDGRVPDPELALSDEELTATEGKLISDFEKISKDSKTEVTAQVQQSKEEAKENAKEEAKDISTSSEPEDPNFALLKEALIKGEYYPGYKKYVEQKGDQGRKLINSNDPKVLQQLIRSEELDPLGLIYLQHRVKELAKIGSLSAHAEPHKAPAVQPSKDGSIVLKVNQPETQTTDHGCWSVSLSTQLQYRGVDLDQATIRAFRPSAEDFNAGELVNANADEGNTIENYTELVQAMLPDTAVNAFTSAYMEKQAEAEKYLRACVDRALRKDNAPLSIACNGHYRTIYGILKDPSGNADKDMLLFYDPAYDKDKAKPITVKDFLDLCDVNRQSRTEDYEADPNYRYQYQFSASWLQDLQINEKGELGGDLQAQGFSYQNGELKHTKECKMDAGTFRTFESGKLAPELPMPIVTYLPKKSFAKLQLERGKKEQQQVQGNAQQIQQNAQQPQGNAQQIRQNAQQAQGNAQQKPKVEAKDISTSSQQKPSPKKKEEQPRFNKDDARVYMKSLERRAAMLDESFNALIETHTGNMWKKSTQAYKDMYNAFCKVRKDGKTFYDVLKKKTPEEVEKVMDTLYRAVDTYERQKKEKYNIYFGVGEQRLLYARIAEAAIRGISHYAKKTAASCDAKLWADYVKEWEKTGRKQINADELQNKLQGGSSVSGADKKTKIKTEKSNAKTQTKGLG